MGYGEDPWGCVAGGMLNTSRWDWFLALAEPGGPLSPLDEDGHWSFERSSRVLRMLNDAAREMLARYAERDREMRQRVEEMAEAMIRQREREAAKVFCEGEG